MISKDSDVSCCSEHTDSDSDVSLIEPDSDVSCCSEHTDSDSDVSSCGSDQTMDLAESDDDCNRVSGCTSLFQTF